MFWSPFMPSNKTHTSSFSRILITLVEPIIFRWHCVCDCDVAKAKIHWFLWTSARPLTIHNENAILVNERIAISKILNVQLFLIRLSVPTHIKDRLRFFGTLVDFWGNQPKNHSAFWRQSYINIEQNRVFYAPWPSTSIENAIWDRIFFATKSILLRARKSKMFLLFSKKVYNN